VKLTGICSSFDQSQQGDDAKTIAVFRASGSQAGVTQGHTKDVEARVEGGK
jgi:hypothetical protein